MTRSTKAKPHLGQFSPQDFASVIKHLPQDCPIVGGQAVAWWARRYGIKWRVARTQVELTSKDIDFWGSRTDLKNLARALGIKPRFPHEFEMTVWVGAIDLLINGEKTLAEFLHTVPGLDSSDPERASALQQFESDVASKPIRVLTPVSMAICKLHNLRHFDQAHRQDERHIKVCLEASRFFISELIEASQIRVALWNCERLISTHEIKTTPKLEAKFRFNLLDGIPIAEIRKASTDARQSEENRRRLENFLVKRWDQLRDKAK